MQNANKPLLIRIRAPRSQQTDKTENVKRLFSINLTIFLLRRHHPINFRFKLGLLLDQKDEFECVVGLLAGASAVAMLKSAKDPIILLENLRFIQIFPKIFISQASLCWCLP